MIVLIVNKTIYREKLGVWATANTDIFKDFSVKRRVIWESLRRIGEEECYNKWIREMDYINAGWN